MEFRKQYSAYVVVRVDGTEIVLANEKPGHHGLIV